MDEHCRPEDDDEIDLDGDGDEEEEEIVKKNPPTDIPEITLNKDENHNTANIIDIQPISNKDPLQINVQNNDPPITPLQQRLLRLKMKMNQSRQLNRREVLKEGERLGCEDGIEREQKRLVLEDKKRRETEWKECHAKVITKAGGVKEAQDMVQLASDSVRKTAKRVAKAKTNRFEVNDYYNPEGQHRNYERNLRSLPKNNTNHKNNPLSTSTYDPLTSRNDPTANATNPDGVKRLADELKRRVEKNKEKRDRMEFEGNDVTYVNQRNKKFNEKIARNYDRFTAEIRQNLERGTAL